MYPNLNEELKGKMLEGISLDADKTTLTVKADGTEHRYGVEGDCCSQSWIEHLEVPDGAIGSKILDVDERNIEGEKTHCERCEVSDYLKVYQVLIKTEKGTVTLEFRNSSNGYYGGSIYRK